MSQPIEPVEIIDVRRRKRAIALTDHERAYLAELVAADRSDAESRRDRMKHHGILDAALKWDGKVKRAKDLLAILSAP